MALSMRQMRAPCAARRVSGQRVARVSLSRRALRVQAVKKSVGDLSAADLQGKKVFGERPHPPACNRAAPSAHSTAQLASDRPPLPLQCALT